MKRLRSPIVVIAAAVAVVLATIGAARWYLSTGDEPITVTAQFDSAAGLYE